MKLEEQITDSQRSKNLKTKLEMNIFIYTRNSKNRKGPIHDRAAIRLQSAAALPVRSGLVQSGPVCLKALTELGVT